MSESDWMSISSSEGLLTSQKKKIFYFSWGGGGDFCQAFHQIHSEIVFGFGKAHSTVCEVILIAMQLRRTQSCTAG